VARLIYAAIASLDGYVADTDGNFDWAEPDEEVFAFVNELERPVGTYLYGRRIYPDEPAVVRDFTKLWLAADKIVYSTTLAEVSSARTTIEKTFDPEAIRRLKTTAAGDITVGGPHLAAQAIKAGLVDEVHLILAPVIVGGGTRALPDDVRIGLELVDECRFAGGMVHLHYRVPS
jgi:dihydrofolate reductase